jgi:GTP-binding protein LepA
MQKPTTNTGFEDVKPMVLLESPVEDYEELRNSMEKLQLNDASLVFYRKFSSIRFGFRCGFLGMLHGDYSRRLEREFNMTVITVPNVSYHAFTILILF